jgi:hypothetical protein
MALAWQMERIEMMCFALGRTNSGGQAATERCRVERSRAEPSIAGSRIVARDSAVVMEDEQIVEWQAPERRRMGEAAEEHTTEVSTAERNIEASLIAAKRTGVDSAGLRCTVGFDDRASSQAREDEEEHGSAPVHGQQLV